MSFKKESKDQHTLMRPKVTNMNIQVNFDCEKCALSKNQIDLVERLKNEVDNLLKQIKSKDEELHKY